MPNPRASRIISPRPPLEFSAARIFAANDGMNQILIGHLHPSAWRAKPPGTVRPIAAIFTHMHNVRCKWVRLTAPHLPVPSRINRTRCTPEEALAALTESAASCVRMLDEALNSESEKIPSFRRDGWAPPWPVGAEMICYMVGHEAHHRGRICMLARKLGYPLRDAANAIWNWEKLLTSW